MSAHTPGPWKIAGNTVYALQHAGWRSGVEQFENRFAASVQCQDAARGDEMQANALLIAAAPDMYEALKAVRDDAAEQDDQITDATLRQVNAAIALATSPNPATSTSSPSLQRGPGEAVGLGPRCIGDDDYMTVLD